MFRSCCFRRDTIPHIPTYLQKSWLKPIEDMLKKSKFRELLEKYLLLVCLHKRKYPAGTPGFDDLTPPNFILPPQIDGFQIFCFRDLGFIRNISVCAKIMSDFFHQTNFRQDFCCSQNKHEKNAVIKLIII